VGRQASGFWTTRATGKAVVVDESWELAAALGYVGNAVVELLSKEDASGEALFLAAECLDLEGRFAEFGIEAEPVEPLGDAIEALDAACEVLAASQSPVPLSLWAALQAVRVKTAR
jgi:hypothetical protein